MKLSVWCSLLVIALIVPVFGQGVVSPASPTTPQLQAETPFAAEINAFETADRKSPPPPGGLLFVGSSSIRFWTTLAQDFPGLPVINRGFGGSQIADSVRYADRIVLPYKPKMVVMYAGSNDLNAGKSPTQVLKDYQSFVDRVHTALPDTRLVYLSINPSVARWNQEDKVLETNRLIQRFVRSASSRSLKLSYLDSHARLLNAEGKPQPDLLRADGLHLNARGYQEWTAILRPHIEALWKADTK
jgi:lysophospholipase L1-like esterase